MARLRFKGVTAGDVANAFQRAAPAVRDEAFAALRQETLTIKQISQEQAPIDTGELVAGHRVKTERAGDRAHYEVSVGGFVKGVNVDLYAQKLHEGVYNLGPRSEEKQRSTERVVGRKFLSRAFDEREQPILKRLLDVLTNGVIRRVP